MSLLNAAENTFISERHEVFLTVVVILHISQAGLITGQLHPTVPPPQNTAIPRHTVASPTDVCTNSGGLKEVSMIDADCRLVKG